MQEKKLGLSNKMKATKSPKKIQKNQVVIKDGYPKYPESEDIYNQLDKEIGIDPENINKKKDSIKMEQLPIWNEKNFNQDTSGGDLEIPGAELDDEQENTGNEDEENNLYSLGGDNHSNLDEN